MTAANGTDPRHGVLRALHDHATRLASELPGPLGRLRVRAGDVAIEIEWPLVAAAPAGVARLAPALETDPAAVGGGTASDAGTTATGTTTMPVTSPIVGTFYRAAEPGAAPFVTVGDVVEAGQTIGVVEAMKLLNPVAADVGGTVAQVCVGNAESVEFGQVLVELTRTGKPTPAGS
jgi:acetyl-CoA carboxylase biotin carboxyl carrier protein